jgi:DNA-directed RNA polymerase specialized sigma24 family protein
MVQGQVMGKPRWQDLAEAGLPRAAKEIPVPDWQLEHRPTPTPSSELEALMMTAPGQNPEPVHNYNDDTYTRLSELLGVEIDLSELEQSVLDCVFVAGLSIRDTSRVLGLPKSTVQRIKDTTLNRIRQQVQSNYGIGELE